MAQVATKASLKEYSKKKESQKVYYPEQIISVYTNDCIFYLHHDQSFRLAIAIAHDDNEGELTAADVINGKLMVIPNEMVFLLSQLSQYFVLKKGMQSPSLKELRETIRAMVVYQMNLERASIQTPVDAEAVEGGVDASDSVRKFLFARRSVPGEVKDVPLLQQRAPAKRPLDVIITELKRPEPAFIVLSGSVGWSEDFKFQCGTKVLAVRGDILFPGIVVGGGDTWIRVRDPHFGITFNIHRLNLCRPTALMRFRAAIQGGDETMFSFGSRLSELLEGVTVESSVNTVWLNDLFTSELPEDAQRYVIEDDYLHTFSIPKLKEIIRDRPTYVSQESEVVDATVLGALAGSCSTSTDSKAEPEDPKEKSEEDRHESSDIPEEESSDIPEEENEKVAEEEEGGTVIHDSDCVTQSVDTSHLGKVKKMLNGVLSMFRGSGDELPGTSQQCVTPRKVRPKFDEFQGFTSTPYATIAKRNLTLSRMPSGVPNVSVTSEEVHGEERNAEIPDDYPESFFVNMLDAPNIEAFWAANNITDTEKFNLTTCHLCLFKSEDTFSLGVHWATVHPEAVSTVCRYCAARFARLEHLKVHQSLHKVHLDASAWVAHVICQLCRCVLTGPNLLKLHYMDVHKYVSCEDDECSVLMPDTQEAKRIHWRTLHTPVDASKLSYPRDGDVDRDSSDKDGVERDSSDKDGVDRDSSDKDGADDSDRDDDADRTYLGRERNDAEIFVYSDSVGEANPGGFPVCKWCDRRVKKGNEQLKHNLTVHREHGTKCPGCGALKFSASSLSTHIYSCNFCLVIRENKDDVKRACVQFLQLWNNVKKNPKLLAKYRFNNDEDFVKTWIDDAANLSEKELKRLVPSFHTVFGGRRDHGPQTGKRITKKKPKTTKRKKSSSSDSGSGDDSSSTSSPSNSPPRRKRRSSGGGASSEGSSTPRRSRARKGGRTAVAVVARDTSSEDDVFRPVRASSKAALGGTIDCRHSPSRKKSSSSDTD